MMMMMMIMITRSCFASPYQNIIPCLKENNSHKNINFVFYLFAFFLDIYIFILKAWPKHPQSLLLDPLLVFAKHVSEVYLFLKAYATVFKQHISLCCIFMIRKDNNKKKLQGQFLLCLSTKKLMTKTRLLPQHQEFYTISRRGLLIIQTKQ